MQSCVNLFLMPLLQHRFRNLLAYVSALFVASLSRVPRARDAVARTRYTSSLCRRIENATVKFSFSRFIFALFIDFSELIFFGDLSLLFGNRIFASV